MLHDLRRSFHSLNAHSFICLLFNVIRKENYYIVFRLLHSLRRFSHDGFEWRLGVKLILWGDDTVWNGRRGLLKILIINACWPLSNMLLEGRDENFHYRQHLHPLNASRLLPNGSYCEAELWKYISYVLVLKINVQWSQKYSRTIAIYTQDQIPNAERSRLFPWNIFILKISFFLKNSLVNSYQFQSLQIDKHIDKYPLFTPYSVYKVTMQIHSSRQHFYCLFVGVYFFLIFTMKYRKNSTLYFHPAWRYCALVYRTTPTEMRETREGGGRRMQNSNKYHSGIKNRVYY